MDMLSRAVCLCFILLGSSWAIKVNELHNCSVINDKLFTDNLREKSQNSSDGTKLNYNPFLDSIEIDHEKTERSVSASEDATFKLFVDENKSLIKKCLASSYTAAKLTSVKIDTSSVDANTRKNKSLSQGLFVELSALNDKVPAQMAEWLLHRAKSEMLYFAIASYKEQLTNDSKLLGVPYALFPGTWMHLETLDEGGLELGALRRSLRLDMDNLPKNVLYFLSDTAQLLTMVNRTSKKWYSVNCTGTQRIEQDPNPSCNLFDSVGLLKNQDSLKLQIELFSAPILEVSLWIDDLESEFIKSNTYSLMARLSQDAYVEAWAESMGVFVVDNIKDSDLESVYAEFSKDRFSLSGRMIVDMTRMLMVKSAMPGSISKDSINNWELNQLETILLNYANTPGLLKEKKARIRLGLAWINARKRNEYAPFLIAMSQYLDHLGVFASLDSVSFKYSRIGSKLSASLSGMQMLAGLAQAKDSIELTNWMDQIAAPVGSYRLKRKYNGMGINAYAGYSWGGTFEGSAHLEQKDITPHLNVGLVYSFIPGIEIYLGLIEFASAISKREMIHGLDSTNRTIEWSDVFVPSAAVQLGLGNTPVACGLGVQYMGIAAEEPQKFRPFLHLSVDMPLLWVRQF